MSPSDAETKLWRAILADPEDLESRLVYADHLGDRGDPLGEFIHLSLAQTRAATPDPTIKRDLLGLLRKNIATWAREIAQLFPGQKRRTFFERGLVEHVQCDARSLARLEEAVSVAPIRSLTVDLGHGWGKALGARPELRQVRKLQIPTDRMEDQDRCPELADLLASPRLGPLESLAFGGPLSLEDAKALRERLPSLGTPRLTIGRKVPGSLWRHGYGAIIPPVEAETLRCLPADLLVALHSPPAQDTWSLLDSLTRLRSLSLWAGPAAGTPARLALPASLTELQLVIPTPSCVKALAQEELQGLRELELRFDSPAGGLPRLMGLLRGKVQLESLTVTFGERATGADAVAAALASPSLRHLHLEGTNGGLLLGPEALGRIETLALNYGAIRADDAKALGGALHSAKRLDVGGVAVAPGPLGSMLERMPGLEELVLGRMTEEPTEATTQVLSFLSAAPRLRLRELRLRYVHVDALLRYLQSPATDELESLAVTLSPKCEPLSPQAWSELAGALCDLPNLGELSLEFFTIDERSRDRLSERFAQFW